MAQERNTKKNTRLTHPSNNCLGDIYNMNQSDHSEFDNRLRNNNDLFRSSQDTTLK